MKKTWKVLLCMALIMTMLLGSVAMAAMSPAEQAAMNDHHAIAGLEGLNNGRDLGGYVTADGQYQVKKGLLLRTAKLADATDADIALLSSNYDIEKVIDLRMLPERLMNPDKKIPDAKNLVISTQTIPNIFVITGEDWLMMLRAIRSGVMDTYMTAMYRQLISDPMAIRGTQKFFKEVLSADGAVLWHCTSGKDRTGIEAYLLMCALGMSEDVARAEYLNTNVMMADEMKASYDKAYKYTHSKWIASEFYKYEGVSEDWLKVALTVIERYGGVDAYLRNVIKLTDDDFAQLRAMYLEPVAAVAAVAPAA
ncbi:MAG: tyrosine-protein phosphatase [Oscillospiraceae bacterium]|nr:tyrosine-protein phosphatase [Oscillospiraceae bacterium]